MNEFWVINISKRNVSLRDLGLTLKSGQSYNLLDSRHFNITIEQIINSVDSGSLYLKRDKIKLRARPEKPLKETLEICQMSSERRRTNLVIVKESSETVLPDFNDEQSISDQKFAEEFSSD
jgi:hypothetical protein